MGHDSLTSVLGDGTQGYIRLREHTQWKNTAQQHSGDITCARSLAWHSGEDELANAYTKELRAHLRETGDKDY